jgi:hypothetical protein
MPLQRSSSKRKDASNTRGGFQTVEGGATPISEKPRKKKKKFDRFAESSFDSYNFSAVQNVETFKNFLL